MNISDRYVPVDDHTIATVVGSFGGPQDNQDNGKFYYGGGSVMADGSINPEPYAAFPKEFYQEGKVWPGAEVETYKPDGTYLGKVIARDHGPSAINRGADLSPKFMQENGINTDDAVIFHFPTKKQQTMSAEQQDETGGQNDPYEAPSADAGSNSLGDVGDASEGDEGVSSDSSLGDVGGDTAVPTDTPNESGAQAEQDSSHGFSGDPNATVKQVLPDGTVKWSDGVDVLPNGMIRHNAGGTTILYDQDGKKLDVQHSADPDQNLLKTAASWGFRLQDYGGNIQELAKAYKSFRGGGDADVIADGVENGSVPPIPQFWPFRQRGQVTAALVKRGFNMTGAQFSYQQAMKLLSAGANSQVIRTRAGIVSANLALDRADQLATEWKAGGYPPLQRAKLLAISNGPDGPQKTLATQLLAQVQEATAQMGTVIQGSPALASHSLDVANAQLNADWDESTFHAAVKQAKDNMSYRAAGFNAALQMPGGSSYQVPDAIGEDTGKVKDTVGPKATDLSSRKAGDILYQGDKKIKFKGGDPSDGNNYEYVQ